MDYDFRNKGAPYDAHQSMYNRQNHPPSSSSTSAPHITNLYPRVGQPPLPRTYSNHQNPPPPSSSSGLGIRVMIKPEYRITAPPQLSPNVGDIPRSTFRFDFDFERKIVAEAEKGNQNWSGIGLENLPSKTAESSSSSGGSAADPVVSKYIASGLSREAVSFAVANHGDNPTKVREFVDGYNLLREMGFSSNNVVEALAMYDNDTDKAVAYFLNNGT